MQDHVYVRRVTHERFPEVVAGLYPEAGQGGGGVLITEYQAQEIVDGLVNLGFEPTGWQRKPDW